MPSKVSFTLGVRANVQPKSSIPIGAKVEITAQGLYYIRSQGWNRKKELFNLPKVTNKCCTLWALHWPQRWKKDTVQFGRQICNPRGPMFEHLLLLVWTPCLMHRCVYLTVHITKLQLQTTFPKPHSTCVHQDPGHWKSWCLNCLWPVR
jgi:hypothetical protein